MLLSTLIKNDKQPFFISSESATAPAQTIIATQSSKQSDDENRSSNSIHNNKIDSSCDKNNKSSSIANDNDSEKGCNNSSNIIDNNNIPDDIGVIANYNCKIGSSSYESNDGNDIGNRVCINKNNIICNRNKSDNSIDKIKNMGNKNDIIVTNSSSNNGNNNKNIASNNGTANNSGSKRKRVSFAGEPALTRSQSESAATSGRFPKQARGTPPCNFPQTATDSSDSHGSNNIFFDKSRWLELNGQGFVRLGLLGKGGSSSVFRIISQRDGQVYAFKKVDCGALSGRGAYNERDEEGDALFDSYSNEIALLLRLRDSPHIIQLVDYQLSRKEQFVSMLLEAGEADLARVLAQCHSQKQLLDPLFTRLVWKDMLLAVDHIHKCRIVHGDLKPANFVFVRGRLKLIDFGIAKSFSSDTTNIYRESQIGTINYMAPEAIAPACCDEDSSFSSAANTNKMRLGRPSDVWSLGCILFQLGYGRPPFAALTTVQKLAAIPNPLHRIQYPPTVAVTADDTRPVDSQLVESVRACLQHDPKQRASISGPHGLLSLPFLATHAATAPLPSTTHQVVGELIGGEDGSVAGSDLSTTTAAPTSLVDRGQLGRVVDAVLLSLQKDSAGDGSDRRSSALQAAILACNHPTSHSSSSSSSVNNPVPTSSVRGSASISDHSQSGSIKSKSNLCDTRSGNSGSAVPTPLKILPHAIQQQILNNSNKENLPNKWSKVDRPPVAMVEKQDMRSILERRILEMRKFMDVDQDNVTATNTFDATGFDFF